jgi:mediator of RNA polymerase II transcription subunit 14
MARNKAWAENIVNMTFKDIICLCKPEHANEDGTQESELICTSEAILKVRKPSRFASLDGLADRDVSYDAKRGAFALRIQRAVGKPVIDMVKSRIKAIDRFVNFLEALDRAQGTVTTESVTLRQITFFYHELGSSQESSDDQAQEEATEDAPKRWRVILDLSKDDIDIEIEKGNPHLRVLDLMRQLVNSDDGIGALMAWLPASLPALLAVDKMESEWASIQAAGNGRIAYSMKTISWMSIEYTVKVGGRMLQKPICLEVKMKPRHSQAWWHVWRSDAEPGAQDRISKALQPIWTKRGDNWLGLSTGAAGRRHSGVVKMLLAVDEAIRGAIMSGSDGEQGDDVIVLE